MIRAATLQYLWPVVVGLGVLPAIVSPAYAADKLDKFSPRLVTMLPPYCKYSYGYSQRVPGGDDPAQRKRWASAMGEKMFATIHHYCNGLSHMNFALLMARSRSDRRSHLNRSISEFDYVIRNAEQHSHEFVLLPEILTKKGETLIHLGRVAEGVAELLRAIEIKPDYWPPYASLSDHYKATGDRGKAREILERGLAAVPDASSLRSRLLELETASDKRMDAPPTTHQPYPPKSGLRELDTAGLLVER